MVMPMRRRPAAVGVKDRGDRPDQRGMGVAEQEVSTWDDGYGSGLTGVFMPAGEGRAGHQRVGVAAEYMDWAG